MTTQRKLGAAGIPNPDRASTLRNLLHRTAARFLACRTSFRPRRISEIEDLARVICVRYIRLQIPLVLISQVHRSGGTLLNRLFDGHPELAVHGVELKLDSANSDSWPRFGPELGPDICFHRLFNNKLVKLPQRGFKTGVKGAEQRRHFDQRRFLFAPDIQYALFRQLWEDDPPVDQRQLLNHYFTSYFNAWLDYQGRLDEKRWIVAFAPRLAYLDEQGIADFFKSYPEGRLIQMVRDPHTWYPSAKHHLANGKTPLTPEQNLDLWCASAESITRNKKHFGDRVLVLRFEDLLERTQETMRALTNELGIAFHQSLLQPTFNGSPVSANSSFPVPHSGIVTEPLNRDATLSNSERDMIERRCRQIYEKVLAFCESATHPSSGN